jgi:FAD/FMN-containing dehydrogenase
MPIPELRFQADQSWTNKHGNVQAKPKRLYDVWNRWVPPAPPAGKPWEAGLAALQVIIRAAEDLNLSVHGLGGGWSLSDAAVTPDFMINTKPLNVLEIGFQPENCDPALVPLRDRLVFAQCGVGVVELNVELERRGLSLATSGASNGQTICGAVSTGTHGSANQIGAMQDFILGFQLVSEGGEHCWIERASRPAVTQNFCDILGTRLVRDDRLFNAALVSFGNFGIIHAVLFAAEPIYLLEQYVRRFSYPDIRNQLATLDVSPLGLQGGPGLPYHFEVLVDPYAAGPGQQGAYARWMFKRPFATLLRAPDPATVSVPGDDLLAVIGGLTDLLPPLIPAAVNRLLVSQYPENVTGTKATHGGTFGATNLTPGGISCELGVAVSDTPAAVDAIVDVAREHPYAGLVALRFVPPSDALLAFTRFGPFTCTIELPAVACARSREAYERIWDQLDQRHIPHTFHWGQCMRPSFQRLQEVLGNRLQQWLDARRQFLTPKGRNTFANPLLEQWGLDA